MIRIRCPNCNRKLRVDESLAAAMCPACSTSFKVSAVAGHSMLAPAQRAPDKRPAPKNGEPRSRPIEPARPSRRQVEDEPVEVKPIEEEEPVEVEQMDDLDEEVDHNQDVEAEPVDADDDSESGHEAPRKRKKKRKKRREDDAAPVRGRNTNLLVAGGMVGVGIVFALGIGVYMLFAPSGPTTIDPEIEKKAVAELEKLGVKFERDNNSPDKPVIAILAAQTDITGKFAVHLEAFPKVRKLDLSGTKFNNVDLNHLTGMTELRELSLANSRVGDDIEPLGKLVNLEKLSLGNTLVRDTGLRHLKGLTKLKTLVLAGSLASGLELQGSLPNLNVVR